MIVLIDNYDSFTYNLVQLIGSVTDTTDRVGVRDRIRIIRNDELTIEEIEELNPTHIIISPGPGKPKDAGISEDVVLHMKGRAVILGVCLGHQGICEAFGGEVTYAKELVHGKKSKIKIQEEAKIFQGLPTEIYVGRYHSLGVKEATLPKELEVIAKASDGEIMAVKHREYEIYGIQFHPESFLTPEGEKIIRNLFMIN